MPQVDCLHHDLQGYLNDRVLLVFLLIQDCFQNYEVALAYCCWDALEHLVVEKNQLSAACCFAGLGLQA